MPSKKKQQAPPRIGRPTKSDPAELDRLILSHVRENPDEYARVTARKMLADHPGLDYHPIHLAGLIRACKKKNKVETVISVRGGTEPEDRYMVVDGTYRWKCGRGPITLPVELADQMFYEYSRHGLDMSQSQMRQKHGLKIWEWNSIKNTLFLYKDANIMSPHTEDTTPKSKLGKMIDERMDLKLKDKQRLIETAYNKETVKRYKQAIEKDQIGAFALERMLDELNDMTAEWKCKARTVRRTRDFGTERKWLVAPIADLHIGARVEGLRLAPDYSPEQTRHLLGIAAARINAERATDVTLAFTGDIIESLTGLNHPNSWESVEYGMIGAKVIKEAVSILEKFIAKVDNVREILSVAGNHDRITASKKEDSRGQVAEIIFYMLRRLYGKEIYFEHEELVLAREIDGIRYVFVHGDKRVIREGKQAVIDYGDPRLFNVIIGAHVHHRKTVEDERSFRWVISPSVFTGNRFEEENAFHARPGFLTFENDGAGRPLMKDHTIG